MTTLEILKKAKKSAPALALLTTEEKNKALLAMAQALEDNTEAILRANARDCENAKGHLSMSMLDRLSLTQGRISGRAEGIRQVVALPDGVIVEVVGWRDLDDTGAEFTIYVVVGNNGQFAPH